MIGFPVTPFSKNEGVDAGAFRENLEFMLNSELAALTCCGSNGELQALTLDEYRVVAEMAGTTIGGKKGLILGVGQTLRTAQEQARIAR